MKRIVFLSAWLLSLAPALAAEKDSLVRWKDLVFTTPFEKSSYVSHFKSNTDYINLFLANAPDPDSYAKLFSDKVNSTLNEINSSGILNKKNGKKIKFIYDLVHKRFLVKYELENRFYEILKNGNYNCVTATALFAIFFEKLNIPYRIVELPTHVYLVAYPESDNIRLETTAPIYGFNTYSNEFKSQYVNNLKKQKVIAADDATMVNELFNKYFFGTESVSLTELVGIHYMNDGILYQEKQDAAKSYEQIAKAYLFYPSERSRYLLMLASAHRLDDSKLSPTTRAEIIALIVRSNETFFSNENILAEFQRLTKLVLDKDNDRVLYAQCYDIVMADVKDPDLSKELVFYYNYENGRLYYNQGNFVRAKPYFKNAMGARPRSSEIGSTFISCLGNSLRNERRNRAILDTLLTYKTQFPSLEEHPNFNSMVALAYAGHFGDCFENNDAVNGERNRELFEQLMAKEQVSVLSEDVVGRAYSEAAAYYFKKGQKTKAKALLDRGLEMAPNNYQLRVRKQMIN